MGTGDGRAVLARGAAEPRTLAIGIDANAAAMADASRRAARPPRKGGVPNALFLIAAAEAAPPELAGLADVVTVTLPWGSLLDGLLGRVPAVAAGIASLVAEGGTVEALISTDPRDGRGLPALTSGNRAEIAASWRAHGLMLEAFRPATTADLAATRSSWARRLRLGAGEDDARVAWRLTLRRRPR